MPTILYILALAVFAQGTSEFVFSGLLPLVAEEFALSLTTAGLLTSCFAVGMVLGAPAMALLGRRLAPRWALSGFLVLFVSAHLIGALAESFPVLLLTRVLAAVANAGFLAVALGAAARIVAPDRQARGLALLMSGTTLALIAGVPLGAAIGSALGWRATLWVIAGLCVPALISLALTPSRRFGASLAQAQAPASLRTELAVLGDPALRRVLVLAVLVNAATFGAFTFLAPIAMTLAALSAAQVPWLLAVFGAGAFLGMTAAGRLGDRRWRGAITAAGPLLAVAWWALAWLAGAPAVLWAGAFGIGGLSFLLGGLFISRIMVLASAARSLGGAFATVALNLGAIVGPVLAGTAFDRFGPAAALVVSGALVAVAAAGWGTGRTPGRPA
ncbi:MFS transporter [Leucobacter sp. M11]|uniref:MFS transporter n=1 Tax=Leucobacter sp. M11 TaxID=2993565 RepID=UPI002D7E6BBF|nr:MFS transporter [Leucobacter sp. M11]MEB4616401.1 MFS transporter [Leucobacter sp. M11]